MDDATRAERILIIDDDAEVAAVLRDFLESEGYLVEAVASASSAGMALAREEYALVLLDLRLPDGPGTSVLPSVLKAPGAPDVMIVTGNATLESAIDAVDAGAAGYIFKPVDFASLSARVRRVLDQRRIAAEHAVLSEQRRIQDARMAQILESTSDGIVFVTAFGRIESANRRAGELLGFDAAHAEGLRVGDVLSTHVRSKSEFDAGVDDLLRVLATPGRLATGEGEMTLPATGRTVRWIAQPVTDGGGLRVGFTLTLRDVTDAREVSAMRAEHVALLTHELRAPLGAIKRLLDLSAEDVALPTEPRDAIVEARDVANRMIGVVNDLLDIARLETGQLTPQREPLRLEDLTYDVLRSLEPLIGEHSHLVTLETEPLPLIDSDTRLLRQVLLNLLSNAIRYTLPGGKISVRICRHSNGVLWLVQDSGPGIPRHAQSRVFDKFYRADHAATMGRDGAGLGLYLARLIVERLGGRIACEAEEGRGATFRFTLPTAP